MAQKNRVTPSFAIYLLIGMFTGVALGFATNMVLSALSKARFEASIVLYRIPTAGTEQAARDFISTALDQRGFIKKFVAEHDVQPKIQHLLDHHLTVFARDPSSPNAEIRLVGKDPSGLEETLDSLAQYLSKNLRSIKESELQSLLLDLNTEIEKANSKYLNLIGKRSDHNEIDGTLSEILQSIVLVSERLFELQFTERFSFAPDASNKAQTQALVQQLTEKLENETNRGTTLAKDKRRDFELAVTLARAEVKLRMLRQTKQRLVIQFNQGTPLRVAGRAKIGLLDAERPPTTAIIGISALLGTVLGGILCSLMQTRNAKLTGPLLEQRFGTPVMASMPQSVTDFGLSQACPMAAAQPQRASVAAIHSFNTALHYSVAQEDRVMSIVVSELGKILHAPHLIANIAVVLAKTGRHVLVIDSGTGQLLSLLNADTAPLRNEVFHVRNGIVESTAELPDNKGSISLTEASPSQSTTLLSAEDFAPYDHVIILAETPSEVKYLVEQYAGSIGLLVCNDKDRVSKIRKAINKNISSLVLCGYPLEESIYGGEASSTRT